MCSWNEEKKPAHFLDPLTYIPYHNSLLFVCMAKICCKICFVYLVNKIKHSLNGLAESLTANVYIFEECVYAKNAMMWFRDGAPLFLCVWCVGFATSTWKHLVKFITGLQSVWIRTIWFIIFMSLALMGGVSSMFLCFQPFSSPPDKTLRL